MRIGIDARFYGPNSTGPGRYTQKLIENLEKIDHDNDYVIFLRKENWDAYYPQNRNFKKVLADYRWYSLAEQIFMPFAIWRQKVGLMHFPHFNVPIMYWGNFIVTIHDLIITYFPTRRATTLGPILYAIKQLGYRLVIMAAAKKSRKIITVSEFSKQEIIKHFKVPENKVAVTYESCDPPRSSGSSFEKLAAENKIINPYLLYVGNTYPHKNLENLLKSFKELIKVKTDLQLVLVGKYDYFSLRLKKEALDMELAGKVVFTGFVNDEYLPLYYQNAALYVFPSSIEGFGLPPLEAMSYGLPVVSSQAPCLPEILQNAAVYFNQNDINDIVRVVLNLLNDEKKRQTLIHRGYELVKKYSWVEMAEETYGIYQAQQV